MSQAQPIQIPQPMVKPHSFVANDPFLVSYSGAVVDAPSNFDDISTGRSSPEPRVMQGTMTSPYGTVLSQPALGGYYYPGTARPPAGSYSANNRLMANEAEGIIGDIYWIDSDRCRRHYRQQTPPMPLDDKQEDTGLAQPHLPSIPHIQPKPPTLFSPPVQAEAQERWEEEEQEWREEEDVPSTVPSIHHSPIIVPNADDTVTPPAQPSSASHSQDIPFTQREPHMGASQSPLFFRSSRHTHPSANLQPSTATCPQTLTEPKEICPPVDPEIVWYKAVVYFFLVAFPKHMYLLLLLRLPSLYFSRVARIFEEADMSLPEIKKMALETASQGLSHDYEIEMAFESPSVPPAYKRLTSTWEFFIDSVMREWKIFNIISVLLLTYVTLICLHCFSF